MSSLTSLKTCNTSQFYRNLKGFSDFAELNNPAYYEPIPDDWFVVISDIVGSTQAIEEGRYKDVNTLGAASISVLQKALGTFHFPFVFGGDGATALIHASEIEKAKLALLGLKAMGKAQFQMDLRVGVVDVQAVLKAGKKIEVAKFFMNPKKSIAMLKGGGLAWADELIKAKPQIYCLEHDQQPIEELSGLSCRWQPIRSVRGKVVTLLVFPTTEKPNETMGKVLGKLNSIFENDMSTELHELNQAVA